MKILNIMVLSNNNNSNNNPTLGAPRPPWAVARSVPGPAARRSWKRHLRLFRAQGPLMPGLLGFRAACSFELKALATERTVVITRPTGTTTVQPKAMRTSDADGMVWNSGSGDAACQTSWRAKQRQYIQLLIASCDFRETLNPEPTRQGLAIPRQAARSCGSAFRRVQA